MTFKLSKSLNCTYLNLPYNVVNCVVCETYLNKAIKKNPGDISKIMGLGSSKLSFFHGNFKIHTCIHTPKPNQPTNKTNTPKKELGALVNCQRLWATKWMLTRENVAFNDKKFHGIFTCLCPHTLPSMVHYWFGG